MASMHMDGTLTPDCAGADAQLAIIGGRIAMSTQEVDRTHLLESHDVRRSELVCEQRVQQAARVQRHLWHIQIVTGADRPRQAMPELSHATFGNVASRDSANLRGVVQPYGPSGALSALLHDQHCRVQCAAQHRLHLPTELSQVSSGFCWRALTDIPRMLHSCVAPSMDGILQPALLSGCPAGLHLETAVRHDSLDMKPRRRTTAGRPAWRLYGARGSSAASLAAPQLPPRRRALRSRCEARVGEHAEELLAHVGQHLQRLWRAAQGSAQRLWLPARQTALHSERRCCKLSVFSRVGTLPHSAGGSDADVGSPAVAHVMLCQSELSGVTAASCFTPDEEARLRLLRCMDSTLRPLGPRRAASHCCSAAAMTR